MSELGLAALIAALAPVLVALVNLLGKRIEKQIDPVPAVDAESVLRAAIRRHILRCPAPGDLVDL